MRSEGDGPLSKSGLPEHSGASGIGVSAVRGLRSCASCSMACSVLGSDDECSTVTDVEEKEARGPGFLVERENLLDLLGEVPKKNLPNLDKSRKLETP